LDNSSKLLFAQNLVNATTKKGLEIFEYIYLIFDDKIMSLLEFSNMNSLKISDSD